MHASGSSKRIVNFLQGIVESAKRMQRLVQSLLRYAQVGNGEIERAPVAMDSVLDAALLSLQVQLEEKRR